MADDLSYTVLFTGSTWRFRLGAYLRAFRTPRLFVPLIVVALFPVAIDRIPALMMPSEGFSVMTLYAVAAGVGGVVVLVTIGAVASILRSGADRIVTFDLDGIHERTGDRRIEHSWSSVIELREDAHTLTLHCRATMKSLQLSRGENARIFVVPRHTERLEAVLAAAIPHVKRITSGAT